MMLSTTVVDDLDQFLRIFSTKGLEKRRHHGSKGSAVFRDPNQADRIWVIFDWTPEGFQEYLSDPDVPAILREAGHTVKPQPAALVNRYDA